MVVFGVGVVGGGVIVIGMNKKSENNMSTERILKGKYLDKDKQKTIPLKHKASLNKIMLTDLCPQEKLKIGQLIKTFEQRRAENQLLNQQLLSMSTEIQHLRAEIQAYRQQFQKVEGLLHQRQGEVEELRREVGDTMQKLRFQCSRSGQLSRKCEQYMLRVDYGKERRSVSLQAEPSYLHQSVQAVAVCSDACMQTDKEERERELFYRPHSKSFQKIMKAPLNLQIKTSIDSRSHQGRTSSQANLPLNTNEEQDQLSQKWDRLKVKHQNGRIDWQESPHSFHATEQEKNTSSKQPSIEDIDELALNRMLRLKDFSASKLMRAPQEQPSSAKPSKDSPEVNYIKSPYFNRIESDSVPITRGMKGVKGQEINFYESGLFEIDSSGE